MLMKNEFTAEARSLRGDSQRFKSSAFALRGLCVFAVNRVSINFKLERLRRRALTLAPALLRAALFRELLALLTLDSRLLCEYPRIDVSLQHIERESA